jgi:hypothetical protein
MGGNHCAGFELRQHGRGKTGVFTQIDEGDFLSQTEAAQLVTEIVGIQQILDRLIIAFRHTESYISRT